MPTDVTCRCDSDRSKITRSTTTGVPGDVASQAPTPQAKPPQGKIVQKRVLLRKVQQKTVNVNPMDKARIEFNKNRKINIMNVPSITVKVIFLLCRLTLPDQSQVSAAH